MPTVLNKKSLNLAFRELRSRGFMARQNFLCCSNCVGTSLATRAEILKDKNTPPQGCVFYHRQDAEALKPPETRWERKNDCYLMIRYGSLDTTKHGQIGLPTSEVGNIVAEVFRKYNIQFEWDGSPDSCIRVLVFKGETF